MPQLSIQTQDKLKELLLAIADGEKGIEVQRKALGRNPLFEPYAAFQRLDRRRLGFLSSIDILSFLHDNGYREHTEAECYYLVQFFDCDEDDRLNYTEWLSLCLPCDHAKLRADVTQRPNYYVGPEDHLARAVESDICRLFIREIHMQHRIEKLKQEISLCYDFTPEDGFKCIDDFNYGYIDFSNLKRFLKRNGNIPANKELAAIIRRLDLDADSKLNKNEWCHGIAPTEPYSKVDLSHQSKV